MKQQPTAEQSRDALNILIKCSDKDFKARLITAKEREKLTYEDNTTKEWWVMQAFIIDSRYWCGWDVFYGRCIVVDLQKKLAFTAVNGIFQDDFVFLSDYYDYPDGAFYYASN